MRHSQDALRGLSSKHALALFQTVVLFLILGVCGDVLWQLFTMPVLT